MVRRPLSPLLLGLLLACTSEDTPDDDATGVDDDATVADDDATPPDDDATPPTDDDATPSDDDTTPPTDDDATPPDDDATPSDDDATASDDDATASDDDATPPDDDTSASDDDVTVSDDDATVSDDDATASDDDTTPPPVPVRFTALGDTGEGNEEQYQVAEVMKSVCDTRGCDFVVMLGDNFYDSGVDSADDSLWDDLFEIPYAAFDIPFYAVLGNHDYGGEGIGWELWKGNYYVEHTELSPIWTMPGIYYSFSLGNAGFFALDTTQSFWWLAGDQEDEMRDLVEASTATWKIAMGHHPYLSNGPHGDAGEYEGLGWIPIVNGEGVKDLLDSVVCGQIDLYLCGHDHSRQWLTETCSGTELIVSGAGAKTTDLEGDHSTNFQSDLEGFFWFEILGNQMTVATYNLEGTLEYESVRVK